ncbi:hypothetical protein PV326_013187 [Microctonus aethiopoides]|nr:hypothetical protein PV326_013187 [Microctonus aethiopoides]
MVNPSPTVGELNSGAIPIDEREQIRRNTTKFARELDPYEIVAMLDLRGLNSKGSMNVLVDRLVRYELCRNFGEDAADWDPREDDRDGVPRTRVGWQGELSMDEALLEVRSNRNNSLNARSNDSIQEQNRQRQKIIPSTTGIDRIRDQMLPTGQSMGPYKDPIAERNGLNGYGDFLEQFRARFLGSDLQSKLWEDIRTRTQGTGEPVAEYLTKMQGR